MFPEGRLFDFLIVGAVALVVVGPKDLPLLMRKVGQFMAKMRAMAAEFRASFDELARQSELDELRREVAALRSARPMDFVADRLEAAGHLAEIRSDLDATHAAFADAAGASPPALEPLAETPAPETPAPGSPAPVTPAPVTPAPVTPAGEAAAHEPPQPT
ncbi:MAG: Sec-independent protein translocase protein TatB, partial [Caulobacteraceae bacterium]